MNIDLYIDICEDGVRIKTGLLLLDMSPELRRLKRLLSPIPEVKHLERGSCQPSSWEDRKKQAQLIADYIAVTKDGDSAVLEEQFVDLKYQLRNQLVRALSEYLKTEIQLEDDLIDLSCDIETIKAALTYGCTILKNEQS